MLEAADLDCERGGRMLFRSLSFSLRGGELLRVAGANGSGKTSLLRILCGLLPPSAGEVRWNSKGISALREDYSRELVYIGHAQAVKEDLSAAENLSIACAIAGTPVDDEAVAAALARFDMRESQLVRRLSQGQRRRASLARLALSAARPLWLLDEPFSALDAEGVSVLNRLIGEHANRGGAIVFTTHQDPGISATRVIELS